MADLPAYMIRPTGHSVQQPMFIGLPIATPVDDTIYFGKKKCCGKFRKKGKKMCKKCPGRN